MKLLSLVVVAFVAVFSPGTASGASITVSHLQDWVGSTNSTGVTYQTFTDAALPSWTHVLSFSPPAVSFDSADVELSFSGTRTDRQEVWLLWDSGSTFLGQLTGTGDNSAEDFIQQTFGIPAGLLPSFPAASWSLALRLTESDSGANSIFMDYSRLTVTYQDGITTLPVDPIATPEPASMVLLASGLAALAFTRYRSRNGARR